MNFSPKTILFSVVFFILALILLWSSVPRPELVLSIAVRLAAFVIAIYFVLKYKEWKILFLAAMFFLMAARQTITFLIWTGVLELDRTTRTMSEIPGYIVTALALLSIIYVGLSLSGKVKLIQEQKNSIATLRSLLPICSSCRKIKDDEGYWREIESYIEHHTDSRFSHGLCEDCTEKLYGNEPWYKDIFLHDDK